MNPDLAKLHPYPFAKLQQMLSSTETNEQLDPILLSIGEPKHPAPEFVAAELVAHLPKLNKYAATKGMPELRQVISHWASKRFNLGSANLCPDEQVIPVNGTREALFAIAQAVVDTSATKPLVVSPNPFYQIYEGAAYLAGADIHFLPCTKANGYIPDYQEVAEEVWRHCQLLYICSPGNPSGAVTSLNTWKTLLELADRYDFIIAADECYSEIYPDEAAPPIGLLEACAVLGRDDYQRCLVFHSLSKRSNLPGLRSGFIAGDRAILKRFLEYRTYHGCAMPLHHQHASIAAWSDESHVAANRALYRQKFDAVLKILEPSIPLQRPDAGFYLWPQLPMCDIEFARGLYREQRVTVLPGQFLSRATESGNPGQNHVRMALVASVEECIVAAERIKSYLQSQ